MDQNPAVERQPSQVTLAAAPAAAPAAPAAEEEEETLPKHHYTYSQETSLRKTLMVCMLGFSFLASILVFVLCIGAWSEDESRLNEDLALASWTETYTRDPDYDPDGLTAPHIVPKKLSVEITWFLNGLCVNSSDLELHCPIASKPTTSFDLAEFVRIADGILRDESRTWTNQSVAYAPYKRDELPDHASVRLAYPGLVVAVAGAACVVVSWLTSVLLVQVRKRKDVVRVKHAVFVALQLAAAACLLAGASMLQAASGEAGDILKAYTGHARYVAQGRSVHSVAWTASVSQVFAVVCIYGFWAVSKRLEEPQRYPPEPRPPSGSPRRQGVRSTMLGGSRNMPAQQQRDEFVDPELPPYAQVDPLAAGCESESDGSRLAAPGQDIEMQPMRSPTYREVEEGRSPPLVRVGNGNA